MPNNLYRLNSISLNNFWCYNNEPNMFEMGESVTVIIGLNGAGKTAFLTAVKKAISFILSKDRRKEIRFIGDGKDVKDAGIAVRDVRFDESDGMYDYDYHYPVTLTCNGTIMGHDLLWYYEKPSKNIRVDKMLFRDALDRVLREYSNQPTQTTLPLLAYFSDSYPHVRPAQMKYEKDVLIEKGEKIERRTGYYHWDLSSSSFYFWRDLFVNSIKRYYHPVTGYEATLGKMQRSDYSEDLNDSFQKRLQNLIATKTEIDYIGRYLKSFTKPFLTHDNEDLAIDDIVVSSYMENSKEVFTLEFLFADGHKTIFERLPEGYKRLIAIAFEICYRFFILNKNVIVHEPDAEPKGIVLIDELELHLHPTLAQESLIRLTKTFPEVQFIVSTHSPAIISNLHNDGQQNKIYRLNPDHSAEEIDDFFGAEYGDTLVMSMGSYGRLHELEVLEELYREFYIAGDNEGKGKVADDLLHMFEPSTLSRRWQAEIISKWEERLRR